MKSIRIALGILFIVAGLGAGAWITLHYFALGISAIRDGEIARGVVLLVVWSEIFGIAAMLALVFPGVLVLRNLDHLPGPIGESAQ